MKLKLHIVLFLLMFSTSAIAQIQSTAGGFTIRHYGIKSYRMHPRNFYIAQDERDVMYFGNAYGVIEYDGNTWRNIPLPHGNSAISLGSGKNKTVYVGSYNELGFLTTNSVGSTIFKSLYSKISLNDNVIGNIQGVYAYDDAIVFQSLRGLYINRDSLIQIISPSCNTCNFQYAKEIGGDIYVQEQGSGLKILKNKNLEMVHGGEVFGNGAIKDIVDLNKGQLIILEDGGLFVFENGSRKPFNETLNANLKQQQMSHVLKLQNGNLLVSTFNNGFYIINTSGVILKHVSIENGLPSNIINFIYEDKKGGVWLALDNGITYIEINTPFSLIGNASGVRGMGYASAVFEGKLYLGTSLGLYYADWKEGEKVFKPVNGISGQIWNLTVIDNTLLCCQVDHTYQIKNNQAQLISGKYDYEGHWKIAPLKNRPGFAIKGTYLGFQLYSLDHGTWKFVRKLEGFEESCRVFEQDENGIIWMCHGNKGMYKIKLSSDLQKIEYAPNYSTQKGFAPDYFNDVASINNHLVFSADDGPYLLDPVKETFIRYEALGNIMGKNRFINRLVQYNDGNIWLFSGDDVILFKRNNQEKYVEEKNIFKKITGELVGSYELVMPVDSDAALLGSQEGFILYYLKEKNLDKNSFNVSIRKVEGSFKNDTLLYGGNNFINAHDSRVEWPFSLNSIRISYTALWYENPEKIKYQYALVKNGDEEIWSGWTNNSQVDFTNLYEGDYTFKVRAKNIFDGKSGVCSYTFRILPPWYRTAWAYFFYWVLFSVVTILSVRLIRTRFKKQKQRLEEQKQKELQMLEQKHLTEKLLTEKELIALRNEKLEAAVVLKNNEIASLATSLTQKSEFLAHVKEKLESIDVEKDSTADSAFKEVIKNIDQDLDFDDNWIKFQLSFDQLHHNFLHRLRERYPKLNPSWLLLCAYIRMNKSNKEIANHMNISVAGVEKRKYRLREKLEISTEEKLSDYIINF